MRHFILPFLFLFTLLQIAICKPRIIGGSPARSAQFPYAAAIYSTGTSATYFCGGAIIDNRWILTAAQCLFEGATYKIQLGSNTLEAADPNRVTLTSTSAFVHPRFNPLTLQNDIGLIKLRLPVTFTQYINSIILANETLPAHTEVIAIGWGHTNDFNGVIVDLMNYVTLSSITTSECKLTYGDQISEDMVCVAGNYNEGTCNNDSGGPLIQNLEAGRNPIIVGVSIFTSQNGCESTDPSGFVQVYPFVDWIQETMSINE